MTNARKTGLKQCYCEVESLAIGKEGKRNERTRSEEKLILMSSKVETKSIIKEQHYS